MADKVPKAFIKKAQKKAMTSEEPVFIYSNSSGGFLMSFDNEDEYQEKAVIVIDPEGMVE